MTGLIYKFILLLYYRVSNHVLDHESILSKIFPDSVSNKNMASKIYHQNEALVSDRTRKELKQALKNGKQIVLIYQMGKVGSTSYKHLLSRFSRFHIIHIHRLNVKSNDAKINTEIKKNSPHRALQERRWKEIALFLEKFKPPVHIITGMRDPISRNISAYFENLEQHKLKKSAIFNLLDEFIKKYPHHIPLTWFNEQFVQGLNVNIFDFPFNKERGIGNIEKENFRCLLLNTESKESDKVYAINQFLKINIKSIKYKNVGKEKNYAFLYELFKDQIEIPKWYLDKMYNSEVVNYFYTPQQIQKFYDFWERTDSPIFQPKQNILH